MKLAFFIFMTLMFFIPKKTFAQSAEQLRDMLNGSSFKQYEKMFKDMIEDMESMDKFQFEQYDKFFDESLKKQLQLFGIQARPYRWEETESEKVLIFEGRLVESDAPELTIKDNVFEIKGTFAKEILLNGAKSISKSIQSVKLTLPPDVDASKVRYENLKNSFKAIFPKKSSLKQKTRPKKKLRSPIKGKDSDIII